MINFIGQIVLGIMAMMCLAAAINVSPIATLFAITFCIAATLLLASLEAT